MGFDFTKQLQTPPKDLYIEVRVLKNCQIEINKVKFELEKNTTHFLQHLE